jgi:hypothetical protein
VFIAVLRCVAPCPGLPCCARRPRPAEGRPKFISVAAGRGDSGSVYRGSQMRCPLSRSAVLHERRPRPAEGRPKFISSPQGGDSGSVYRGSQMRAPCPGLPCRARRPRPAKGRPKFISVRRREGRFRECLSRFSDALPPVLVCRVARDARVQRRVDRNSFRSPQGGAIPGVFIAVLRCVAPCPGLPCRTRRPRPAEGRPKFISVIAWGALFSGAFNPVQQVQHV